MNETTTIQPTQTQPMTTLPVMAPADGFHHIWELGVLMDLRVHSFRGKQRLGVEEVDADPEKVTPIIRLGHKDLFEPAMLKPLAKIEHRARHLLADNSQRFPVGGARFVPRAMLPEVRATLDALKTQFEAEGAKFVQAYASNRATMLTKYPTQLKASDYPPAEAVQFQMDYHTFTLNPGAGETEESARDAVEEFVRDSLAALRQRVQSACALAAARIQQGEPLTQRHLNSLRKMLAKFAQHNFVGDARIEQALKGLEALLAGADAKVLKGSEAALADFKRALDLVTEAAVADDADEVVSAFTGRAIDVRHVPAPTAPVAEVA